MKTILYFSIITLLLSAASCKKQEPTQQAQKITKPTLSLKEAQNWLNTQSRAPIQPDWKAAIYSNSPEATSWLIPISGKPKKDNLKGYSRLLITRNHQSQKTSAQLLDYLPDGNKLQEQTINHHANRTRFTGRIYSRSLQGELQGGYLVYQGKPIGEISPDTSLASKSQHLLHPPKEKGAKTQGKLSIKAPMMISYWVQSTYVGGGGTFTVHSERVTEYYYFDNSAPSYPGLYPGPNPDYGWQMPNYGGGGGGRKPAKPADPLPEPETPEPSNLPGEDKEKVNPKNMMDCFKSITSPTAVYSLKVHVQEPLPGTSFNIGPNSFGHVALEISATSGETTITQTIGFYPTGSGIDKISSKSRILDNSDLAYDVSATYYLTPENFSKLTTFVSDPPQNYHFTDYNCAAFAINAAKAAGAPIPSGYTSIGIPGPGGAGTAQTPAGLGAALRDQQTANPSASIYIGGGRASASKGECR